MYVCVFCCCYFFSFYLFCFFFLTVFIASTFQLICYLTSNSYTAREREKAASENKKKPTHLPLLVLLNVFLLSNSVYSWFKIGSPISSMCVRVRVCCVFACAFFMMLLLFIFSFVTSNESIQSVCTSEVTDIYFAILFKFDLNILLDSLFS